jgi:hypothetical protein
MFGFMFSRIFHLLLVLTDGDYLNDLINVRIIRLVLDTTM